VLKVYDVEINNIGGKTMDIETQFTQAMIHITDIAKDYNYYPAYFLRMVHEHGGVGAAKRLLSTKEVQAGLMRLWELKLLNKSMEALVIQERYKSFFTEEEVSEARRRLDELHYFA